jgi:hypothetical protein
MILLFASLLKPSPVAVKFMGALWFLGVKNVAKGENWIRRDSITDGRVHRRVVGHAEASIIVHDVLVTASSICLIECSASCTSKNCIASLFIHFILFPSISY